MDHTRASVLSVCTAAIIGAGAGAGGLEEGAGAGGPTDWLECGVRVLNDADRASLLEWNPGTFDFEFLTLDASPHPGLPGSIIHNWVDQETGELIQNSVGMFIPTFVGQDACDRLASGRLRYVAGVPTTIEPSEVTLPAECAPQLICRPLCLNADIAFTHTSIAGLVQTYDGRSAYVLGTNITLRERDHETGDIRTAAHLFNPSLLADDIPLNQGVNDILPWLGNRTLAESGEIDLTVEQIDQLFSTADPPGNSMSFHECHKSCFERWDREMDLAEYDRDTDLAQCRAARPGTDELIDKGWVLGGCGIGVGIGAACGALPGAIVGGAIGGVVGLFCSGFDGPPPLHEDEEFLACARTVAEAYWERVDGIMDRYERCHDDCLSNGPVEGISPIGNPGGER